VAQIGLAWSSTYEYEFDEVECIVSRDFADWIRLFIMGVWDSSSVIPKKVLSDRRLTFNFGD
jgi:hypothetical protein